MNIKIFKLLVFIGICVHLVACGQAGSDYNTGNIKVLPLQVERQPNRLAQAAESIIDPKIVYDPSYFSIPYPNGDVPKEKGVCTDVVIRSLRKLGLDLQKEIHQDMTKNFGAYPNIWGATTTDKNIDHRRVPNQMKYFDRKGYALNITQNPKDYQPGDIVSWKLNNGLLHIGIISNKKEPKAAHFLIVHNIGGGQILEDVLFKWDIIGHYRLNKN
ncbi:MAG TPA: DUF1287 domain-containing protein [Edaphocola sp.]|nr:DUF1287 domain-containing protein [Edaphocola sp.]